MPKQKDLKRLIRGRMEKTGESYTAARLRLVSKREPDYAALAGMSDDTVRSKTGRDWREWTRALDARDCSSMPHKEIVQVVRTMGVGSWWCQTVTVGYERIRGIRVKGQRCDGDFEASKSRTFAVPVEKAFDAFAKPARRKQWLPVALTIRSATPHKRMRIYMEDQTLVEVNFLEKGLAKCAVAIQHSKLADKAASDGWKAWWSERLEALSVMLRL